MTSHAGRLYAIAVALLVFFVVWAGLAARPWVSSSPGAQAQVVALRRQALARETKLVNQILALQAKKAAATPAAAQAPGPAVRVVTLPPLTITRTS